MMTQLQGHTDRVVKYSFVLKIGFLTDGVIREWVEFFFVFFAKYSKLGCGESYQTAGDFQLLNLVFLLTRPSLFEAVFAQLLDTPDVQIWKLVFLC